MFGSRGGARITQVVGIAAAALVMSAVVVGGAAATGTGEIEERTVYRLEDGEFVPTWECLVGETTYQCSLDGVEEFRVLNQTWPQYPLPDGMLVDVTPYGVWVIQGDDAVPVDDVALQHAQSAITVDEFLDIASSGSAWPPTLLGVEWTYVWAALAAIVLLGVMAWRFAVARRGKEAVTSD